MEVLLILLFVAAPFLFLINKFHNDVVKEKKRFEKEVDSNIDYLKNTSGRTHKPRIKNLETRERYFKVNNIKCTCLVGYMVCDECYNFYND